MKFTDKGHTYMKSDVKYTSVTTLIHRFVIPFNEEYWSLYKAAEAKLPNFMFNSLKSLYGAKDLCYHIDKDTLQEYGVLEERDRFKLEWRKTNLDSQVLGTKFHNEEEDKSYERGWELNPIDGKKYTTYKKERIEGENYSLNILELEEGYYPELLLWNDKYRIAGQADKVFLYRKGKDMYFDIGDYKTNKEIKMSNRYQKMISPLNHLDDCNYNHYRLQISMYAWMLEQFGLKRGILTFDHYKYDGTLISNYHIKYAKKEIQSILSTL